MFGLKQIRYLLLCLVCVTAQAHVFHTSLMRLEYNADEKLGEITLQLFAQDLATALTRRNNGERVNLEKDKDLAKRTLDYLKDNFTLKNARGEAKELTWVGAELKADMIIVYLETPLPEGLAGARVKNTIFFDVADKQINLVNVVAPTGKASLVYEKGDTLYKTIALAQN